MANDNQILLYRTQDGEIRLEVLFQDETVWCTQGGLAELFQKDVSTIIRHMKTSMEEANSSRIQPLRFLQ